MSPCLQLRTRLRARLCRVSCHCINCSCSPHACPPGLSALAGRCSPKLRTELRWTNSSAGSAISYQLSAIRVIGSYVRALSCVCVCRVSCSNCPRSCVPSRPGVAFAGHRKTAHQACGSADGQLLGKCSLRGTSPAAVGAGVSSTGAIGKATHSVCPATSSVYDTPMAAGAGHRAADQLSLYYWGELTCPAHSRPKRTVGRGGSALITGRQLGLRIELADSPPCVAVATS